MNALGPHSPDDILVGARIIPADKAPTKQELMSLPAAMQQVGGWAKDKNPSREKGKKLRWWRPEVEPNH